MGEIEEFLEEALPRLHEADTALHNGDPGPRMALWSRSEPLTLFGAARTGRGWAEIESLFRRLAATFSDCSSFENDIIAAGASGDLAYTVAYEHTTASVAGEPAKSYSLRVTTVFRREAGEWKIVHRHADPITTPQPAESVIRE